MDRPKPLGNRVLAVRDEALETTKSGIFLTDAAKEQPQFATVLSVGSDVTLVAVGDRIIYKEYASTEMKIADKEYLMVDEEDILALLEL